MASGQNNPIFYAQRGLKHLNSGNNDEAINDFFKARELGYDNDGLYNNLGIAFARKLDFDKAIDYFNRAIKLNPKNSQATHNLREAEGNKKRLRDAELQLEEKAGGRSIIKRWLKFS